MTEKEYLDQLKQHLRERSAVVTIKTVGAGREPSQVLQKACDLRAEADREGDPFEFCCLVVDVDEHAALPRVLKAARDQGIDAVVTNPKFELWLLWHYQDHTAHISSKDVDRALTSKSEVDGKHVTARFPVHAVDEACARARRADPDLDTCRTGENPSSAMPWLIDRMHARP